MEKSHGHRNRCFVTQVMLICQQSNHAVTVDQCDSAHCHEQNRFGAVGVATFGGPKFFFTEVELEIPKHNVLVPN